MIGVRFEYDVSKVGNCFLHTILDKVDVDKYVWNINFDDIYLVPCKGNDYLFHSKILDGTNFLERISKAQYVVIQCNLQAFPTIDSVTDRTIDMLEFYPKMSGSSNKSIKTRSKIDLV